MTREPNRRPRRNPLTAEEVAHIVAHRRKHELVKLYRFKKSRTFKVLNVLVVCCIFVYLELLFCYFGPCHYQKHYSVNTYAHYGTGKMLTNNLVISDIDLVDVNGKWYKLVIDDNIQVPAQRIQFVIGKDFILQKELKGIMEYSDTTYRLFSASPVLFLCLLASFVSFFSFVMNLNENAYALAGLVTMNLLSMLAIIAI